MFVVLMYTEIHTLFMIWQKIELRLNQLGWKPADLARALNVENQYTTNWKKRGVPASRHKEIAKVLDVSLDWLLATERKNEISDKEGTYSSSPKNQLTELFDKLSPEDQTRAIKIVAVLAETPRQSTKVPKFSPPELPTTNYNRDSK